MIVLTLSACGSGPSTAPISTTPTSPYIAEVKAAAVKAKTGFERQVLSDGIITPQEYHEAVNRLVKCASDRGVAVTVITRRGVNNYSIPSTSGDSVVQECSRHTTGIIESLYTEMVVNPSKQDPDELSAQCLRRSGLADASFTGADFHKIFRSNGALSFPFNVNDSRFDDCQTNPSGPVPTATARP